VVSVSVFILVFVIPTGMGAAVVIAQIAADGTTRSATEARANGRTGRPTEAVTDYRTTRRAQATANRRLCATALASASRATGGATHTGANRSASTAAYLPADYVTQCTAKTTAHRSGAITGRHCQRCEQQPENQRRQYETWCSMAGNFLAFEIRCHGVPRILQGV
jgi:hypothetical protein